MSHPAWVCGLKHPQLQIQLGETDVTPCVGVWIETKLNIGGKVGDASHPAWVCGLKLPGNQQQPADFCHTLRGCVD